MHTRSALALALASLLLASCGAKGKPYTLYRNSVVDRTMRVHFATFDATDGNASYNLSNCEMTARLLNANVTAMTEQGGQTRDPFVGFWCEPGVYSAKGGVPTHFPAAFPTDV